MLLASVGTAAAQAPIFEVRPMSGAFIPTGQQRDLFRDAALFGVKAAVHGRPAARASP